MIHLDLFSGIGGFSIASDNVFKNVEHIFCEINPFCKQVLKKHWPQATIYEDIKQLDTAAIGYVDLLTGGFPCQPFSSAGKKRGKEDDRYLWPEMLRIIKECKPTWIIGENVAGIINMALEQVCSDLEGAGYEVQPLIIPACAVDAPHRRDRVWIIGYAQHDGFNAAKDGKGSIERGDSHAQGTEEIRKPTRPDLPRNAIANAKSKQDRREQQPWLRRHARTKNKQNATNSTGILLQGQYSRPGEGQFRRESWRKDWLEVATELCGVGDGLPVELDGLKLSESKHRNERIKALGNAIVPQVAIEIMKATNL